MPSVWSQRTLPVAYDVLEGVPALAQSRPGLEAANNNVIRSITLALVPSSMLDNSFTHRMPSLHVTISTLFCNTCVQRCVQLQLYNLRENYLPSALTIPTRELRNVEQQTSGACACPTGIRPRQWETF